MNENVGASFGLSFLIVGFFAVALYQPETPPPPVAAVPRAAPVVPVEARPPDAPAVSQTVARVDPPRTDPPARHSPKKAEPVEPRGAFTLVREGETLADVARRVYGSDDARKRLWLANRDRLDRPDDPPSPGSILRTP